MKKFLNINKQRILALFFVMVILGPVCIFSVPVSAASYEFPVGLLFNETLDIESVEAASFPFTFECNGDTYDALDLISGRMYFMAGTEGLLVYEDGSFLDSDYRYIKALSSSMSLDSLIEAFSGFGSIVKYESGSNFLFPEVFSVVNFTEFLDFSSNGTTFTGVAALTFGNPSIQYRENDTSYIVVYGTTGWVDTAYRSIKLTSDFVPKTLRSYDFFQAALVPPPSFLDRVTSGLTAVIGWVGTVVTAIVSGELVALRPLVAIGIAVSTLFLAWLCIRKFVWGR